MSEKDFKRGLNFLKEVRLTTSEKDESLKNIIECINASSFLSESPYLKFFHFFRIRISNNNRAFEKGIWLLKQVRLTTSEKDESFKKIVEHIGVSSVSTRKGYFTYLDFLKIQTPLQYAKAMVVLVLLVVGSVAYAAENSLPGDIVYPVKINVNEFVKGALTFGTYAKANWQNEKIDRRVLEAEELARQGRLSGVSTQNILVNISNNSDDLRKNIASLNQDNAEQANNVKIGLAVKANIQARVLNDEIKNTTDTEQVKNVQMVKDALVNVTEKIGMKGFLNNYSIGDTKTDVNIDVNSQSV